MREDGERMRERETEKKKKDEKKELYRPIERYRRYRASIDDGACKAVRRCC